MPRIARGAVPRLAVLALLFACLGQVVPSAWAGADDALAAARPAWPERLYNPRPLADDVLVPMPCGGAIAFRPVATPAGTARTHLIGPFAPSDGAGERYLLIGKYEVTALQYRATMAQEVGGPCPAVQDLQGNEAASAQVGVSRIDAVNFAARLSRWLHANAQGIPSCGPQSGPCLPRVDGKPAFVRLPLDEEWEYAARGGSAVSDRVFAQARYPMPEGLERHAWYNRNADGSIAPIGLRLPSPLGLHDLYGNAWEVMNDPYRSERFPGQVGGDVLRGGGIHSAEDDLQADLRVELQPFDSAGDVRTADTGFRVLLAAPVVTSLAKLSASADSAGASQRVPAGGSPTPARADPAPRAADPTPTPSPVRPQVPPIPDGRLRIRVDAKSIVLVDGEVRGAAVVGGYLEVSGLPRGSRRVEARAAGYANAVAQVEIAGADPVEVRLHLEPTPERAESLLALTQADRGRVQAQLGELGYTCDPAQRDLSRGCRAQLEQFQHRNGLAVTGYMNTETRALLERQAAERQRQRLSDDRRSARETVTPPPLHGRYLQIPEPYRGGGLFWMDPDAP
jgi:hypothetical protein